MTTSHRSILRGGTAEQEATPQRHLIGGRPDASEAGHRGQAQWHDAAARLQQDSKLKGGDRVQ